MTDPESWRLDLDAADADIERALSQGEADRFDHQRPAATYKQMGKGVNIGAVWHVLREHVRRDEDVLKRTRAGRAILDAVLTAPLSPDERLEALGSTP